MQITTQAGRLKGRIALVTGGASGIGAACAARLAGEGASVLVTDVQDEMGQKTVANIVADGGIASYLHHDVTSESEWEAAIAHVKATYGGLNVLVNNAGIGIGGSIVDMTLSEWQRQQAINLDGVFMGVKHSIPVMRDTDDGGSIINISSVAGIKGAAMLSAYNATKGGVRIFSKGVALECAQNRWPIRVNSVHPGIIATPIWDKINPELQEAGMNTFDLDDMAESAVPTGQLGYPIDIANGVLFLASDESRYMTGTELVIDGGLCA